MNQGKRVVVAVTAASGAIYARQIVELLLCSDEVLQIALVYSRNARDVMAFEGELIAPHERVVEYSNDDMFAPLASGSAGWDSMIIAPCSVGTIGRVAAGLSDSLITRCADVMLKERRPLIFVVREMPLSLIHLQNMTTLVQAGATIIPASPNFYTHPQNIEELTLTVSRRTVEMLGIKCGLIPWEGGGDANNQRDTFSNSH